MSNQYDIDDVTWEALRMKPATLESTLATVEKVLERLEESRYKDKLVPERVDLEMLVTKLKMALK